MLKLLDGNLLTTGEIALMRRAYGDRFAEILVSHTGKGAKWWAKTADALGLPKAVKSSIDISAPGRQGFILVTRKEWYQAWGAQLKALLSEKSAVQLEDVILAGAETRKAASRGDLQAIENVRRATQRDLYGLEMTSFGERRLGEGLNRTEEAFQTSLARKIPYAGPLIHASNRAFVTYLNKLRADMFDNFALKMLKKNLPKNELDDELRNMAVWLNIATGRANLSQKVASSDVLIWANKLAYSPKLFASRVQTVYKAGQVVTGKGLPPHMRKEIARDLVGFAFTNISVMTLMYNFGWITDKVELNPLSSDFGKGRIGNTRYDPWASFQPIIRYIAQISMGMKKNPVTKETTQANRMKSILSFLRSKADPGLPAFFIDATSGQTFMGEDVDYTSVGGIMAGVRRHFIPLYIDDVVEAIEAEGWMGAVKVAGPAGMGIGVVTFEPSDEVPPPLPPAPDPVRYKRW
jgi:hypothetical protein